MSSSPKQKQDVPRNDSFAINKTVDDDSSPIDQAPTIIDQVVKEEEVANAIATLGLEDEIAGPMTSENTEPKVLVEPTASELEGETSTDKAATQQESTKSKDNENITPKVGLDTTASKSEGDDSARKAAPQLEALKSEDSVDMAALRKTFESFGKDLKLGIYKPETEDGDHEAASKSDNTKLKEHGVTSQSEGEDAKPALKENPRLATYFKLHNQMMTAKSSLTTIKEEQFQLYSLANHIGHALLASHDKHGDLPLVMRLHANFVLGCSDEYDCFARMDDALTLVQWALHEGAVGINEASEIMSSCTKIRNLREDQIWNREDEDEDEDEDDDHDDDDSNCPCEGCVEHGENGKKENDELP